MTGYPNAFHGVRMSHQVDAFAVLAHDPNADRHESRIPRSPFVVGEPTL